ncbi:hypothetical protein BaRGS_00017222, partial [Batillaria attramentaria]
ESRKLMAGRLSDLKHLSEVETFHGKTNTFTTDILQSAGKHMHGSTPIHPRDRHIAMLHVFWMAMNGG